MAVQDLRSLATTGPENSYQGYLGRLAQYRQAKTNADKDAYEFSGLQGADTALINPATMAAISQVRDFGQDTPQSPLPPQPGQASVPSNAGPNLSYQGPMAPQPQPQVPQGIGPGLQNMNAPQPQQMAPQGPPGGAQAGLSLPQAAQMIMQANPSLTGAGLRQLLTTINSSILNPEAKMQQMALRQQALTITQQNADTNAFRAGTAATNTDIRYHNAYAPTGPAPAPPNRNVPMRTMGGQAPMPGAVSMPAQMPQPNPDIGNGADMLPGSNLAPSVGASAIPATALAAPPAARMSVPQGAGSYAAGQGNVQESKKNADLRTQYTASIQNDMSLADNLNQLVALLDNPNAATGTGSEYLTTIAGALYQLTGDPKWGDSATYKQLDQKAMAGVLVDQVANLAATSGGGSRSMATDVMKRYVAQMKPEQSKTVEANKSVVQGTIGTLARNSLMKQFFNDVTQQYGIYPRDYQLAVLKADRMYPIVEVQKGGSLKYNAENADKFAQELSNMTGNDYSVYKFESPTAGSEGIQLGTNEPPQEAIRYLTLNPNLKSQFDEKYGPGAAAKVLGNGK